MDEIDLLLIGLVMGGAYMWWRSQQTPATPPAADPNAPPIGADPAPPVTYPGNTPPATTTPPPVVYVPWDPNNFPGAPPPATQTGPYGSTAATYVSAAGDQLIKSFEGYRDKPYRDGAGYSIGWGHHYPAGQAPPAAITQAQAQSLFNADIGQVERSINSAVHVPLNQNQYDAIADLIYNWGSGNFANSTVLQKLNAGDYNGAADALLTVTPSLRSRRTQERSYFLTPVAVAETYA